LAQKTKVDLILSLTVVNIIKNLLKTSTGSAGDKSWVFML